MNGDQCVARRAALRAGSSRQRGTTHIAGVATGVIARTALCAIHLDLPLPSKPPVALAAPRRSTGSSGRRACPFAIRVYHWTGDWHVSLEVLKRENSGMKHRDPSAEAGPPRLGALRVACDLLSRVPRQ